MKLHRSLTFWLGLPGFLFILWSWQDSMKRSAGIFRERTVKYTEEGLHTIRSSDFLGQSLATLTIRWHEFIPDIPGATRTTYPPRFQIYPIRSRQNKSAFPPIPTRITRKPFPIQERTRPTHLIHEIAIPHWFILLVYTAAWIGLIVWRTRRVKRLKKTAALDASPSKDAAA